MADAGRNTGPAASAAVAEYYDRNTRRFLLMGRGAPSMHRALWAPGVESEHAAMQHVDRVLSDTIAAFELGPRPVIVDFGCGVGGTLFHLAQRFPNARLTGVTVSPRQVETANRLARERGLVDRCAFVLADFQVVDPGTITDPPAGADVIVAVESFAHSASPEAFLANAARHLHHGGRLIVVDDFLAAEETTLDARAREHVRRFREGWRLPALSTVDRVVGAAATLGLVVQEQLDLTSLTRPRSRLRDRLTALAAPLFDRLGLVRLPFYGNLIGGNALQLGLSGGFLRYRMLVFTKSGG